MGYPRGGIGGAVGQFGHYVGFAASDGRPLAWLQRVQNFMPNGLHAVAIEPELCRVEMFRYENTYDLLITQHQLARSGARKPTLSSEIIFFNRSGELATELWGKDSAFREEWRHASSKETARNVCLRTPSLMRY